MFECYLLVMSLTDVLRTCTEWYVWLPVSLAVVNQVLPPIVISVGDSIVYHSSLKVDKKSIERYKNLPEEFDALDYLNLASSIVHNKSKGNQKCLDYAFATYDVYRRLIKQNDRNDLRKKIRIVGGVPYTGKMGEGHEWLEVEINKVFVPFEATNYTPTLGLDEIRSYSKQSLNEKRQIDCKPQILTRSFRGSWFTYPTLKLFLYPGGLVRMGIRLYRYSGEMDALNEKLNSNSK